MKRYIVEKISKDNDTFGKKTDLEGLFRFVDKSNIKITEDEFDALLQRGRYARKV